MFKNLVALVTGGAGGLGRATAHRFAQKGSKVVVCDLPSSDGANVAADLGENVHYIAGDITSEADIQNVMKEISSKYGKLDVLVNCAGRANAFVTYNFNNKHARSLEDFQQVFMTNVLGTLNVCRLAAEMIGRNEANENGLRGIIINTSGTEAYKGTAGQAATAAASGGIHSLTKPLAVDFGGNGIRVVSIAPGLIRTKLTDHWPRETEECIAEECIIAPNRLGAPDEFAHLVHTIVANPYINATTIELSAGLNLSMLIVKRD